MATRTALDGHPADRSPSFSCWFDVTFSVVEMSSSSGKHVNAGYYCAVPECSNRSSKPDLHFHRFPVNADRRKQWCAAIRRDLGADFTITAHTRICSDHFLSSDYRKTKHSTRLELTAVPSVFPWSKPIEVRRTLVRHELPPKSARSRKRGGRSTRKDIEEVAPESRSSSREDVSDSEDIEIAFSAGDSACSTGDPGAATEKQETTCDQTGVKSLPPYVEHDYTRQFFSFQSDKTDTDAKSNIPPPHLDHDYTQQFYCSQADQEAAARIASLEADVAFLRQRSVSLASLTEATKGEFKTYTGVVNKEVFYALTRYLDRKAKRLKWWRGLSTLKTLSQPGGQKRASRKYACKLSVEEQFFWTLFRLRPGSSVVMSAKLAGISTSTFSKMFTTWVNFLAYELKSMHSFPSSRPRILIHSFKNFPHTRVIIDCTEVCTKRPSGLSSRKQLFSSYKHHNTVKFLVGISPSGSILYVSNMWGGRASDQKITRECGLLNDLQPGHEVMADHGFTVEQDLAERNITLLIPSFLGNTRSQLTAPEVTSTRRIAEARVYVERAIERIRGR